MEEKELIFIQGQIGYNFKNPDLLQQAFVRRSYAMEHGGQDNEVLEFIGDKVLDIAVVRLLALKYGYMANGDSFNEYVCTCDEGKLSELKQKLVEKKTLAQRIDDLGIADFLIMGKGDIRNNINEEASVKEDLFEAILGAVALDCDWNMQEIFDTVEIMLEPEQWLRNDNNENYVELIQEWVWWKHNAVPWYHFKKESYQSTWYYPFKGISQPFNVLGGAAFQNIDSLQYQCLLRISGDLPIFRGFGSSKSKARMAVCELAYNYLAENGLLFSIKDEIENPNQAEAINQLEILARRGYFSLPTYDYEQEYDEDGNPIWTCECHIAEYDIDYGAKASSKKEAKKDAAFQMLTYVLNEEE